MIHGVGGTTCRAVTRASNQLASFTARSSAPAENSEKSVGQRIRSMWTRDAAIGHLLPGAGASAMPCLSGVNAALERQSRAGGAIHAPRAARLARCHGLERGRSPS